MKYFLVFLLLPLVQQDASRAHVHGAALQTELHNDTNLDVAPELSVVENWSLICKQLCGSDLGGAPCSPHCSAEVVSVPISDEILQNEAFSSESSEFCEILCENELGGSRCGCKKGSYRVARMAPINKHKNAICSSYCTAYKRRLQGCSPCPLEFKGYRPPITNINRLPPQNPPPAPSSVSNRELVQPLGLMPDETTSQFPTESTTPDWNKLCIQLCKNGQGGILCNCDLPPF